ncbi:YczE/YyaS/YitT family protein [Pelistega europaea]|uniref:YitT family protein n=1 Tax=Pelistega europaea TaxID=106147 RepID=A0A7Y4LAP0_9BURK|nr:YitT family protein [Pelistega europaea]NOL50104.1 YitT family protein [Pelistega europaea]
MSNRKHTLSRTPWSANSFWIPSFSSLSVLVISLLIFGVGDGFLVLAHLGSTPWTVLAQGIATKTGGNIGLVSFFISASVMITWLPFKQKPGLGTVLNITLIAVGLGATASLIPAPETLFWRIFFMLCGVLLIGVSSAFYLTCHMGPGPRDGLMVGLYQTTGLKIGTIRTIIEGTVCLLGWLLGGVVGVGTLIFALGVGWVLQFTLEHFINRFAR